MVEQPVDDLPAKRSAKPARRRPPCPHLGLVVPKRLARRAVTRNLVKRQVRAFWTQWWREMVLSRPDLTSVDWVVRLRAPIDKRLFISARSESLGTLLRGQLPALFEAGVRRIGLPVTRPVGDAR